MQSNLFNPAISQTCIIRSPSIKRQSSCAPKGTNLLKLQCANQATSLNRTLDRFHCSERARTTSIQETGKMYQFTNTVDSL